MSEQEATQPSLSVVIASQNARASVRECLNSLEKQRGRREFEIILVDNSTDGTAEIIGSQFPHLKLIKSPDAALIPELWETGIRNSDGAIIATTTTHFIPREDWVEQILRAHDSSDVGIGGAIENDSAAGLTDWAVYFCRYSPFMLPFSAGTVGDMAADNASYKREALELVQHAWRHGFWEAMIHAEFRRAGLRLLLDPAIVVCHKKSFTLSGFVVQRYRHGKQFGGARAAKMTFPRRLVYVVLSPLIPLLFLTRIARRVATKRRHIGNFLLSLPILMLFILSWSLGELSGYLLPASNRE